MLFFLQKMLNTWPADYKARYPLSNTGRLLKGYADQLEYDYNRLLKLNDDIGVLSCDTNKKNNLYLWETSAFQFETNGSYIQMPAFTGDLLTLTECIVDDINHLPPSRMELHETLDYVSPLVGTLDSETLTIDDYSFPFPVRLVFTSTLKETTIELSKKSNPILTYLTIEGIDNSGRKAKEVINIDGPIKHSVYEYIYINQIQLNNLISEGNVTVSLGYNHMSNCYWKWPFLNKDNEIFFPLIEGSLAEGVSFNQVKLPSISESYNEQFMRLYLLGEEDEPINASLFAYDNNRYLYAISSFKLYVYSLLDWVPDYPEVNNTLFPKTKIVLQKDFYQLEEEALVEISPATDSDLYKSMAVRIVAPDGSYSWLQEDETLDSTKFLFSETELNFKLTLTDLGTYTVETYCYNTVNGEEREYINSAFIIVPYMNLTAVFNIAEDDFTSVFCHKNNIYISNLTQTFVYRFKYDYFILDKETLNTYTLEPYEELNVQYL